MSFGGAVGEPDGEEDQTGFLPEPFGSLKALWNLETISGSKKGKFSMVQIKFPPTSRLGVYNKN